MLKLVYTDSFDPLVGTGVTILTDKRDLQKSASTIFDCRGEDITPDKDHIAMHLVAFGDEETYGPNRNADGFPKHASETYHPTFQKYGHVYEHHRNKDPKKKLGDIVKTAYNDVMNRVELIIHANIKKAEKHLERAEKEGSVPMSMACSVNHDRCVRCNTLRKTINDPDQCDHVRYDLGKMGEDGKLTFVHNDEPKFFDISFVTKPADRTAYAFKMASGFISSTDLADEEGVIAPEILEYQSTNSQEKLALCRKLANFEKFFQKISDRPKTGEEHFYWELRKAACIGLPDATISELRNYPVEVVTPALARRGVILSMRDFYKYAFGDEYQDMRSYVERAEALGSAGLFTHLEKSGHMAAVCNDGYFERGLVVTDVSTSLAVKVANAISFTSPMINDRAIEATLQGRNPKLVFIKYAMEDVVSDKVVNFLLEKYASYKLAALRLAVTNNGVNKETVTALAVAQDMFN